MEEKDIIQTNYLLETMPGGIAKIAFDDVLTILYATDNFYSLIETVSKVVKKAPLALLRIVYSADIIYVTQQLAAQKHRKDNMLSINFRTLQKDGSFRWVMITGQRTAEVYTSGNKDVYVYSCIAMDITDMMVKYKKLEQSNEYNRAIMELSKELYFEYEIATDTLVFNEIFREIFGKDATITNFREKLENTKIIHSEELPAVIKIFKSMMSGKKQVRFEMRLISKSRVPNWYLCYASIIYDENRNPHKVVGKLATVKSLSREEESSMIPEEDALTKVYTKASAEAFIHETLSKQHTGVLSALMLIDIKNFKAINDILKSTKGENILTIIGELLKKQFRSTDIIGRVGVGSFMVFLKGVYDDKNALNKAEQICKAIEELYSYRYSKNNMYANIGIAFVKDQNKDYHELYSHANKALELAKKAPNSSFEVYCDSAESVEQ